MVFHHQPGWSVVHGHADMSRFFGDTKLFFFILSQKFRSNVFSYPE